MKHFNELNAELVSKMPNIKPTGNGMSQGFANIVFSYRVRNGLTQQQLAEKADVGVKTIHRIEGGSGGITDTTYGKVLSALGINWQEAFHFLEERENGSKQLTKV